MNYTIKETTLEKIVEEHRKHTAKIRQAIYHDLKHQNNRACGNPMYCVMETIITDEYEYIDSMLGIFFTNREAEKYLENYIATNKHAHKGSCFVYVKSGNDNEGWKLARELMLKEGSKINSKTNDNL